MMKRSIAATVLLAAIFASVPALAEDKPNPWFAIPATASFSTGDAWTYAAEQGCGRLR